MALTPGARLGPYEVVSLLGAGGMGEVYRAKDTKLGRDVAIKVLPDSLANDAERLARFEREAKVLAALNHPNIAHIHGFEDSTGAPALVMELVEGPTLADWIARGRIPIDDALAIARQIAEALESAHEQGIIHRDLKPANIKVRDDGTVKVLDFGLAKAMDQGTEIREQKSGAASMSPTITTPAMLTGVGVILGTAAYMSPEQAKGRSADKRSDIWAFGCVLYEMLAGKRAFEGEDVGDTLAAVLRGEPDWKALPHDVPAHIRSMITRCLDKSRQARVSDIAVTRYVLAEPASASGSSAIEVSARRPASTAVVAACLGIAVVATLAAGWLVLRPGPAPRAVPPVRFVITPATGVASLGTGGELALSPDGSRLAYASASDGQLMVRSLDQIDAVPLPGIRGARSPFFSPDGRSIGFFTRGELKRVAASGGPVSVLCRTDDGPPLGATWMPDGTVAFAIGNVNGILAVPASGGEPRLITTIDFTQGEQEHRHPSTLPDGSSLLFTVVRSDGTTQIAVANLKSGKRTTLIRDGRQAEYLEAGYLVYALRGTLQAVRFNVGSLMISGDPFPVAERVRTARGGVAGTASFAASRSGAVAFVSASVDRDVPNALSMVWVDRRGAEQPLPAPERRYAYPRISPDGTRIAVDIQDQDQDIWVWDLARRSFTRLTFDAALDSAPVWMPEGRHIVFNSTRAGTPNVFRQAADGTGTIERLTTSPHPQVPFAVSPDGTMLLREDVPGAGNDLVVVRPGGPGQTTQLVHLGPGENNADLSPDGHWIAYQAQASVGPEIYVRPFPNVDGGRWQISTNGGAKPVWARTGRELFYLELSSHGPLLTSVTVQTTPTFNAGPPNRVLETPYFNAYPGRTYDVAPDGERFLMTKDMSIAEPASTPTNIVVMLNWLDELKARVPTR